MYKLRVRIDLCGVSFKKRAYYVDISYYFQSYHIPDKCRPSISVRKKTALSEKERPTQLHF